MNNIIYSRRFYTNLHFIEIAFRNRFNLLLIEIYGENWLLNLGHIHKLDNKLNIAIANQIKTLSKKEYNHDDVVANLNFGTWISILLNQKKVISKKYFSKLFNLNKKQLNHSLDSLCGELLTIKNFRNRIFHYERVKNHLRYKHIAKLINKFILLLDIDNLLIDSTKRIENN